MNRRPLVNIAQSVYQRLLTRAKKEERPFNELLQPESAIAQKYQAMVDLDKANSRMKDFHDVWTLTHNLDFDGKKLAEAIRRTFEQRKTALPQSVPTAFTASFYDDKTKQTQWEAFLRKGLGTTETPTLTDVTKAIHDFLMPITEALKQSEPFTLQWEQGGTWQ